MGALAGAKARRRVAVFAEPPPSVERHPVHADAQPTQQASRGIRILPGGDYGFAWTEHGTNAKDLEYFVRYLGFTPMEAIRSADTGGLLRDARLFPGLEGSAHINLVLTTQFIPRYFGDAAGEVSVFGFLALTQIRGLGRRA